MNNKYTRYTAMIFVFALFFVSACTPEEQSTVLPDAARIQQQTETQKDVDVTENIPESTDNSRVDEKTDESIGLDKIYNYNQIKNFEYQITTSDSGTTVVSNMKYSLSSDTVNGKAAWLSTAEATVQGTEMLSKTWTDKLTFECLKTSSIITFDGQTMETPIECPKSGPEAASNGEIPMLKYVGVESVTVPLGTYTAKKYLLDDMITYWYTNSVPIPIKVSYAASAEDLSSTSVMELVDWN